ncbi:hypothetical protein B0J12DRAFT_705391 [Macrophomina phaseolina]|uniref:Chitin-binding type 1 n=1 Tax=Macrophomina phaseolina TaxID=35725 RepID=A0ABQ8FSA4_9PEZI|nr:hypothetical protein B0J12DRAFT_705391 [Macrophomina phaseolina]
MAPGLQTCVQLALFASLPAVAHVGLQWPVPFDETQIHQDRSPIASNYPCHTTNFDFSDEERRNKNTINVGQEYQLSFYQEFYAVHNGGTCQLSITLDDRPNVKSVFKTFYTIEGGCPGWGNTNGNGAAVNQTFMLPGYIPKGKLTLAWSWFPATSGNYEMYMNCAPIYVPDGSDDHTEFDKLPDMLVANVPSNATTTETGVSQREYLDNWEIPRCSYAMGGLVSVPAPGNLYVNSTALYRNYVTHVAGANACGTAGPTSTVTVPGQLGVVSTSTVAAWTPSLVAVSTPVASAAASTGGIFAEALSAAELNGDSRGVASTTLGLSSSPCSSSNDGQMICNGALQYGICQRGTVAWRSVALGTMCENGAIGTAAEIKKR